MCEALFSAAAKGLAEGVLPKTSPMSKFCGLANRPESRARESVQDVSKEVRKKKQSCQSSLQVHKSPMLSHSNPRSNCEKRRKLA